MLKSALGFGLGLGARVGKQVIDVLGNPRGVIGIVDAYDVPADLTRPIGHFLADPLVHILVVKHHRSRVGCLIARIVYPAHDKIPLSGINIALHRHNIPDLEIVAFGDVDPDDAGVAFALESFELVALDQELGVDIKKTIRIDGQTGEKLILIDVHTGKPNRVSNFIDARYLRDAVAVSQRQRENK